MDREKQNYKDFRVLTSQLSELVFNIDKTKWFSSKEELKIQSDFKGNIILSGHFIFHLWIANTSFFECSSCFSTSVELYFF